MNHWASQYIGIPWAYGAQGPDSFDCWNFVKHIQHHHFSIKLSPTHYIFQTVRQAVEAIRHSKDFDRWQNQLQPVEGDIVLMARNKYPAHVGVWIAANGTFGVLHCIEGYGVIFTPSRSLAAHGWGHIQFYRHVSKCTT